MSSQTTYFTKTKCLYSAVFMALVGTSSSSYAINFGETVIQSAQNEPLSATITVSDVNSSDFDVSLANDTIYQQMGLTPNTNITATFQPTSQHTGKIILKSSVPIKDPFADIVLDINNQNKKQFMPKTLLMPVGNNPNIDNSSTNKPIVASGATPNLPKISTEQTNVKQNTSNSSTDNKPTVTQTQLDQPKQKNKNTPIVVSNQVSTEPPIGKLSSDKLLLNGETVATESAKQPIKSIDQSKPQSSVGQATYVVRKNDNLWIIAYEIAKQNKTSVAEVMKQIHDNNPNAFVKGNANLLIPNKTLVLPSYEVVPSQSSLEKAISAKRESVSKNVGNQSAKVETPRQSNTPSKKPGASNKPQDTSSYTTTTKPRVSLVTPKAPTKQKGKQSNSGTIANSPLIAKLQSSRQKTAHRATRVKQLNSKVSSYTQKLQLQNKKLAELEARLKKLKGQ